MMSRDFGYQIYLNGKLCKKIHFDVVREEK